jgi:hypothetical protein
MGKFRDIFEGLKKPKLDKDVEKILKDLDKLLDLDNVKLSKKDKKLVKESTSNTSYNSLSDALKTELPNFNKVERFTTAMGDIAIEGVLHDGTKGYKRIKISKITPEKKKEIINYLNTKLLPKL